MLAAAALGALGENLVRAIVGLLCVADRLAVSSTSRALRAIVKRAGTIPVRAMGDETDACRRAWPSSAKLTVVGHGSSCVGRPWAPWAPWSTITDLALEDAVCSAETARLLGSVRALSLTRCAVATLDFVELALVSIRVASPVGGIFPAVGASVRSVLIEDVSFSALGPIAKLPALAALSVTRPFPSASIPRPFETIGSIATLTSLTLRHVDAMNTHLGHIGPLLRLDAIHVEMCVVCADCPILASDSAARAPHECSAYTRTIARRAPEPETPASPVTLSDYEAYMHARLACPLIEHQYGLKLLFRATIDQFDRTYRAAVERVGTLVKKKTPSP